jgi:glycosyltransferase involved in cell wall biosynthesis
MRIGKNPSKHAVAARSSAPTTVALLVYVPFETGYFREGLDVLKLCLQSIYQNTTLPHDIFVFDNGSTKSVVDLLVAEHRSGRIQYLALAGANIGKAAALNFIIGATPGEFLAYTDGDAFLFPGWLEAHMQILETFPDVGIVNGLPARHLMNWATESTVSIATDHPDIGIESGKLIPEETLKSICEGTGRSFDEYLKETHEVDDLRLTCRGVQAFVGAHHFQFLARKSTLLKVGPVPVSSALGTSELEFDQMMDKRGYLRLSTAEQYVFHLGNTLTPKWRRVAEEYSLPIKTSSNGSQSRFSASRLKQQVRENPVVKRVLLKLYGEIFDLYYYGEGKPSLRNEK